MRTAARSTLDARTEATSFATATVPLSLQAASQRGLKKKCASKARCPLPSGRCDKAGRRRRRYHAVSWKHEVLQIHLSMKNIEVKVGIVREIVSA